MQLLTDLTIFGAQGVPGTSPSARLAVPLGILVFYGSIYLLLRANLGTRRAYLVLATSFFGFMIIMSLFWTLGAPGTPQAAGPTYLPTQPSDAYQPTWTPFAGDSLVAERPDYAFVQDYPDGFGEVPEDFARTGNAGVESTLSFFAESGRQPVSGFDSDWEPVEVLYAEAPNGFPVVAVTFQEPPPEEGAEAEAGAEPDAEAGGEADVEAAPEAEAEGDDPAGDPAEEPETVTLFAFYDEGAPLFPGFVFIGLSLLGFLLHAALLNADEGREQRELAELAPEEEKVPAGA
ncbi:MAG TPA: hypothetical protein VM324_13650 [Egibacteraceae bacterium]|nr:hypothetical protein [Egibacteraceae bacterium]